MFLHYRIFDCQLDAFQLPNNLNAFFSSLFCMAWILVETVERNEFHWHRHNSCWTGWVILCFIFCSLCFVVIARNANKMPFTCNIYQSSETFIARKKSENAHKCAKYFTYSHVFILCSRVNFTTFLLIIWFCSL